MAKIQFDIPKKTNSRLGKYMADLDIKNKAEAILNICNDRLETLPSKSTKKAYFVSCDGDGSGEVVVATHPEMAILIAWEDSSFMKEMAEDDYYQIDATEIKKCDISGLNIGLFDNPFDGLRRKLYWMFEEMQCPKCREMTTVFQNNGKPLCQKCIDKGKK